MSVGNVLVIISGVTMISGSKWEKAMVAKNDNVDPRANKPSICLIKPLPTVLHFLYTAPTLTALEGPRNGATHMEPIITTTLFANKPPVARRADATTRAK